MKRKVLKAMLGLAIVASMGIAGPAVLAAETETETVASETGETETETAEEETETAETEAAPDVEVKNGKESLVTLKNESGYVVKEAAFTAEAGEDEETEEAAKAGTLTLTGEDGKKHIFENVDFSAMADPVLVTDNGFLYIKYQNTENQEKEAAETADEVVFDKEMTMYVVNDVYVRAEADGDSEALAVASLGGEVKVIGASPKWYKVEIGEVTGYVARAYLAKDKESADAAVKAEEAAVAQAQAAAAAAAAQAAQQQAAAAAAQPSAPQGKYEVSREAFDDCDGSGHGYYLITYSDGSTATEEY